MTEEININFPAAIEAVLFTMGRSVPVKTLTEALGIGEEELENYMKQLAENYEREDRGIRVIRLEDAYQLCTKKEYYDILIKVASHPAKPVLTETVLEVLSVIAYKQPVTKGEVERIRGVSCDYAVNRLIEFGLVEEAGRLNAPGRPILFKTTEEFLRLFGISSPEDLPRPDDETKEKARLQAYREAKAEGMEVTESDFAEADPDIAENPDDDTPIEVDT